MFSRRNPWGRATASPVSFPIRTTISKGFAVPERSMRSASKVTKLSVINTLVTPGASFLKVQSNPEQVNDPAGIVSE